MLENQTYKNFKVFIVGDNYTDHSEFETLCQSYKGEIYYYNSPIHFRNGYFNIPINKWSCGGMNSRFIGIKQAIKEGYDYYLHLDDDDFWSPEHIHNVYKYIISFPKVDFMISKSHYKNTILPREHNKIIHKKYNNFTIKPCNSVHSSWVVNLNTIGDFFIKSMTHRINIINKIKNKHIKETELSPFDAHLLSGLQSLQKLKRLNAICILETTVRKKSDINIPI